MVGKGWDKLEISELEPLDSQGLPAGILREVPRDAPQNRGWSCHPQPVHYSTGHMPCFIMESPSNPDAGLKTPPASLLFPANSIVSNLSCSALC